LFRKLDSRIEPKNSEGHSYLSCALTHERNIDAKLLNKQEPVCFL